MNLNVFLKLISLKKNCPYCSFPIFQSRTEKNFIKQKLNLFQIFKILIGIFNPKMVNILKTKTMPMFIMLQYYYYNKNIYNHIK